MAREVYLEMRSFQWHKLSIGWLSLKLGGPVGGSGWVSARGKGL